MNRLRTGVDELDEIFMGGGKSETNLNKIIELHSRDISIRRERIKFENAKVNYKPNFKKYSK